MKVEEKMVKAVDNGEFHWELESIKKPSGNSRKEKGNNSSTDRRKSVPSACLTVAADWMGEYRNYKNMERAVFQLRNNFVNNTKRLFYSKKESKR